MTLHFILACHNRRNSTVACLRSVETSARLAGVEFDFTLFDDGSSDGTAEAVIKEHPTTVLLHGDGTNFWAKSMAQAEASLLQRIDPEQDTRAYIVWLNDDVILDPDAIGRLLKSASAVNNFPSIIVGAMRDPLSGITSYSGLNRGGFHPLDFRLQEPKQSLQHVEAFNGNLVLVPLTVARRVGGINGAYGHGMADIDYGIRAGSLGISNFLAPGTYGICSRNEPAVFSGIRTEWKNFTSPKGPGHFGSMQKILKLTSPRLWPLFLTTSYCLWLCKTCVRVLRHRHAGDT